MIKWSEPDIGTKENTYVKDALKKGIASNGYYTKLFEKKFAEAVQAKYAVSVCNGTTALTCALEAINQTKKIDTVHVPSFTFIATANTAAKAGKKIKFHDCDGSSWNLDKYVQRKPNDVVVSVDVGGLPTDYDVTKPDISDSAESFGATYKGRPVGSQAKIHTYSFHTAKIITCGEGGMCTTNNKKLYELMLSLKNHGYAKNKKSYEYKHDIIAHNFRMSELQAALGLAQLERRQIFIRRRKMIADYYKNTLGEYQTGQPYCVSSNFFFGVLVYQKQKFIDYMLKNKVEVKTWSACHKQKCFSEHDKVLPNTEHITKHLVLLPIHNKLTMEEAKHVVRVAKKHL